MTQKKTLAILNLTGEFLPELGEYFSSRAILIVDPLKSSDQHEWTHIITKDVHNFDLINETYKLTLNDIHVISLSKVDDLQNFTINNGNMVLDDCWFKGPMGAFITDKYFQGYGGISLGDNYPTFKEEGSFNIANPFNTGEYLDRMVQKAFEAGVEALTLKTYFDHLVMYLAGLKKKNKAGLPFEVTYGAFEEIFAIQVHFFSQKLEIMDVATSLSSSFSRKAEEYFLNVAVQSADFFDFSYMPDVNKVVVTALWTKDERIQFENRGLMFSSLEGGVSLVRIENDNLTPLTIKETELEDFTDKVSIPSSLPEEVSKNIVKGSKVESEGSVTVSGGEEETEGSTLVKGSSETEDEALIISGDPQLEELIQTVRGKFEEDKSVVRLSGDKLDVDKFAYKIAASVDETTQEKDMKVRSLGTKLPESIKTGLFDFAKNLNKDVEELDDHDLDRFQVQKMPEIIKQGLASQIKVQSLPQKAQLNEMKVQSLAGGMPVMNSGVSQEALKAVEARLLTANSDNEKLKTQLKALSSEVRILKESRNKMAEIQMKASQAANEISIKESVDPDEALKKLFQQKLNDQKSLNEQDLKKLSAILEKESKLMADLKQEEMKARKLQIEAQQKETYFMAELEKSERQTKAKDLILIKTKETFTKLLEKKEREISDLKSKSDQLSKALASGPSTSQNQQLKDLEKQNQNLNKQLEVYKVKISSMATNMGPSKNEETLKDESRKLQMINQQMKNQLDLSKREVEKLQNKNALDNSQIVVLKQDKVKLEQLLKKATLESVKETAPQHNQSEQELKRLQAQNQILETQVKDSSQKINNLENKLAEALKPQKVVGGGDDNSKVKVTQLENSVKKLTQDLLAAKNQLADEKKETNKLRQDKTALQNQVDKMKKEADKGKPASPKKPGGKAA